MIIGVDFDNTIVCYDGIFHRLAVERGLIPPETPVNKTAVRDHLRRIGHEAAWTELQGVVYGPRMAEAEAFPGVKEFFGDCRARGITVRIVSHKTQFPFIGGKHDLHAAARAWLGLQGFSPGDGVFFEATKQGKLARIAAEGCAVFVDDLPEFLAEALFPAAARKILFDPAAVHDPVAGVERARSWQEIGELVFGQTDAAGLSAAGLRATEALFQQGGRRLAASPVRLKGGANNRVFVARDEREGRYVLKHYFHREGDARNRFESERLFYRLTGRAAPAQTPHALGWDSSARLGLFDFVEGRRLRGDEIGAREVDSALEFFAALNCDRARPEARELPRAAEACFTLEEHRRTVDGRIERLNQIPDATALDREARDFVVTELRPAWRSLCDALATASPEPLPTAERCVSPSDFGFHNALRRPDGALVFLDFEYAGWDDPAKTVGDFFCQPSVPVPMGFFERFAEGVAIALGMPAPGPFLARCRALLPFYRLKWCCIVLNEFVGGERVRREFALGEGAAGSAKARQLAAARGLLASVQNLFHGTIA